MTHCYGSTRSAQTGKQQKVSIASTRARCPPEQNRRVSSTRRFEPSPENRRSVIDHAVHAEGVRAVRAQLAIIRTSVLRSTVSSWRMGKIQKARRGSAAAPLWSTRPSVHVEQVPSGGRGWRGLAGHTATAGYPAADLGPPAAGAAAAAGDWLRQYSTPGASGRYQHCCDCSRCPARLASDMRRRLVGARQLRADEPHRKVRSGGHATGPGERGHSPVALVDHLCSGCISGTSRRGSRRKATTNDHQHFA